MKARIVYSTLGVIISLFALTSVASLGSYTNQSETNLMATQAQLQALQQSYDQLKAEHDSLNKEYAQLKADNEKLGQEYAQSQSDLEAANQQVDAANSQIDALTGDLQTVKDQNQALRKTLAAAKAKANILVSLFDDNTSWQEIEDLIVATHDAELLKKWDAIHDQTYMGKFIIYLSQAILDAFD